MLGVRGFRVGGFQGLRVLGLIKAQGSGSLANVQASTPQKFKKKSPSQGALHLYWII